MIKKVINSFLNLLFPNKCLGCGKENMVLCPDCLARIDYPTLSKTKNVLAATDYNDELAKRAIWLLKYRGIKQLAEPLAELIKQRSLKNIKIKDSIFIPIPLSPKRLRERGFNQAELIAKYLTSDVGGKNIGCLLTNVLYKTRETSSQVSVRDKKKRLDNLKESFGVKNQELIKDKNIILIDDVSTTGTTIAEAKKVLREAGAKSIVALVVARG